MISIATPLAGHAPGTELFILVYLLIPAGIGAAGGIVGAIVCRPRPASWLGRALRGIVAGAYGGSFAMLPLLLVGLLVPLSRETARQLLVPAVTVVALSGGFIGGALVALASPVDRVGK